MQDENFGAYTQMFDEFSFFIEQYQNTHREYAIMLYKCLSCLSDNNLPAKYHLFRMRQKSILLEKLGKRFREITIEMKKKEKSWKK